MLNIFKRGLRFEITAGIFFRVLAIICSLISMPIMLKLVENNYLGIWFTIVGILQWVTLFDFGITSGARNKIAKLRANGNHKEIQKVVSETYASLMVVTAFVCFILVLGAVYLPISSIIGNLTQEELTIRSVLVIAIVSVGINFVFSFSYQIYAAYEQPLYFSLSGFLISFIFLVLITINLVFNFTGIYIILFSYVFSLLISNFAITFKLFIDKPEIKPNLNFFSPNFTSGEASFGIKIFVIQICALVLFTTIKLVVSWQLGPSEVVVFEAGFRLISVIILFHTIVMNSYWSTFTVAYERSEWEKIRGVMVRLMYLMIPIIFFSVAYVFMAPWFIELWMGKDIVASDSVYLSLAIFMVLSCWSNIFAYFVNGIGRVTPQMYSAVFAAIINIPLSILLINTFNLGLSGAIYSTCISLLFFSVIGPVQVISLLKGKV
tara:strand:- start:7909 stop:9213 length:1305 start_codon:yes stop_codon:yes gene_type:complete